MFTLVIESLAEAIRTNLHIYEITVGKENHVFSLFADDVLLYLRNPEKSVPAVLNSKAPFYALSGCRTIHRFAFLYSLEYA